MDRKFRPEAFVEFLNWNLVGELMPRGGKCFQLRGDSFRRVRKVLGMADKYGVVYDNMVGERFIERCADIWHSVGLIKSSNRVDAVYLGEERMKVDVPREIHLADDKVVVPQRFVLRRLFGDGQEAVGLVYEGGDRQLAYENGIWKFAD